MSELEIRLLGGVQVLRAGRALPLPASKKTRALLGYLVATGRPHLRERLCDLLWEGPDDPRAELRWSLTKLRPLLNEDGAVRLRAEGERVGFEALGAEVDLARLRALLAPGAAQTGTDALRAAVQLLEEEFLDGLDLPACPRFYEWCAGEREAVSMLRTGALRELVGRLGGTPEEALGFARRWTTADPLAEPAHAALVRLLGTLGRTREALAQHRHSRQLLEGELPALSGELDEAWRALRRASPAPAAGSGGTAAAAQPAENAGAPLVGREAERRRLDGHVSRGGEARGVLMLLGEPGIGKSRLLEYAGAFAAAGGGRALAARAFEAEVARPYGIWVDALRALGAAQIPEALRPDLAVLLPELGAAGGAAGDRARFFDGVAELLRQAAARHAPLVLLFDDLQWADDASCSLLHYVARAFRGGRGPAIVCAARPDELENSGAARNLMQSLRTGGQLEELRIGPLQAPETAALVRAVAPSLDAGAIHSASDGNPLFALELARSRAQGLDWTEHTLGGLIRAQLARLDPALQDVLTYAAALGREFTPELLGPACGFDAPELLGALGELERRALLRAAGEARYDFAHDLVREAAYRRLSQPRRRLLHAQIARAVAVAAESDASLAAELARHASAAGEHALAARACADAGERALRAFASVEATTLAEMGLAHLHGVRGAAERVRLRMRLLEVKLLARTGPGARRPPEVAEEIAQAAAEAERAGLHAVAATGHHLLSLWYQQTGDAGRARESSLRSADAGRAADDAGRARYLARSARCLLDLERDVPRARVLLEEASAAARRSRLELCEQAFSEALLERWDGELERAAASLGRALALARKGEERWLEFRCLACQMMLEMERGRFERVERPAAELIRLGGEMGEADVPLARVLRKVAALARGERGARAALEEALRALREVSDKSQLAYALNQAAAARLARGEAQAASAFAAEALASAEAVHRAGEALVARALLARCAAARGEPRAAREIVAPLCAAPPEAGLSTRARAELARAAEAAGLEVPTQAPTGSALA